MPLEASVGSDNFNLHEGHVLCVYKSLSPCSLPRPEVKANGNLTEYGSLRAEEVATMKFYTVHIIGCRWTH